MPSVLSNLTMGYLWEVLPSPLPLLKLLPGLYRHNGIWVSGIWMNASVIIIYIGRFRPCPGMKVASGWSHGHGSIDMPGK